MSKPDKVVLTCPGCGHQQRESPTAFSSVCKQCGRYLRVQELLKPPPKAPEPPFERKTITCFDCGAELQVAASARSTMCKRCSSYIDLLDYDISSAVSKNFKTKGNFVVQPKGYVFNTEALVGDALIKGKFLGRLVAEGCLTLCTTAEIKGTFTASRLLIPAGHVFRWPAPIQVGCAEIAGELIADLHAQSAILVKSTGRLFGGVEALSLTVETGGVLVGNARIARNTPA